MTDLNGRIYLLFGIIEVIGNKLFESMNENDRHVFDDILTLIYNVNNIPNKIKFKVLDIQDMVKTFEKNKKIEQASIKQKMPFNVLDNLLSTIPESENDSNYDLPIQIPSLPEKKIYKPINYSSLKLVQMPKTITTPDIVLDVVPNVEIIKPDLIIQDVNKSDESELIKVEANTQEAQFYKPKKNYKNKYKEQNTNMCEIDKNDNTSQNNKRYYKNNKNYNTNNTNTNINSNSNNTNTNTLPRNQNDAIFNKTFSNNEEDDGFTKVERKSKINNNGINNNSTYDNKKNFKKY
jgi:hypothetical protein